MYPPAKIQTIKEWLKSASTIVITAHKSADGDSVGSSLALMHYLHKNGLNAVICHPDKMPFFYEWIEVSNSILTYEENKDEVNTALNAADIIFCLDYNQASRIGEMEDHFRASKAKKIMIDHHQKPEKEAFDVIFSFPEISSTCELIYEFIDAMGHEALIDRPIGEALYCGIMTDTGSFRFPSTTARTHRIIANLIEKGVENHKVHERVYDVNTITKLKLNGFAISKKLVLLEDLPVAYITLSSDELKLYNANKGDTEGLVNKALSISGIKMAVFLKEDNQFIKISFRSKGNTYVNELARKHFEGGGHIYAAGGKFDGSMDEAFRKLVTLLPEFVTK